MRRFGEGWRGARAWLLVLGVCTGFAACTGSLFQSKAVPPSVYLLSAKLGTAAPPAGAPRLVPADLAVLRPRVRAGLETDRIAVLFPDRHLDYLADARWSGPLDAVVQDLALQAFASSAHLRNVSADSSAFASGYWLEIEIGDFQAEYPTTGVPPTVHVGFSVRVGGAGDRRMLGVFDASAREVASDDRVTAIIAAYERAVDSALVQVVASASRILVEDSEHR
ncbi:MAG: hypothetical protein JWN43_3051 [Gammaproteobacteria bacterium]|nr:hypothetical protein [Gammaproteobacteria bacterium]